MDHDEDAFLYGDDSATVPLPPSIPSQAINATRETSSVSIAPTLPEADKETKMEVDASAEEEAAAKKSAIEASIASLTYRTLASYGIQAPASTEYDDVSINPPTTSQTAAASTDSSDSDSDSEDDDLNVVFSGIANSTRDFRAQAASGGAGGVKQQSVAMGIGKWAQTPTAAGLKASAEQALAIQGRPATLATAPAASAATPQPAQPQSQAQEETKPTPTQTTEYLPPSRPGASGVNPADLPPQPAPPSHPSIDPTNPTGLIPSSNQSTYAMDVNMFEGANFPWRRPGADIADWFNYGFDEVSWRRFLGYRNEMERGREQMMAMGMNPEIAGLLHMPQPQQQPGGFDMNMMNMMGMGMPGPGMNGIGMGMGGMGMAGMAGVGNGLAMRQPEQAAANSAIKVEASEDTQRGAGNAARGAFGGGRGGRGGAAIPTGPRGSGAAPPAGPKASTGGNGRFKDKDRVDPAQSDPAAAKLDYESAGSGPSSPRKRSSSKRERSRERERDRDSHRDRRERERSESDDERRRRHRSSRRSSREKDKEREKEKEKKEEKEKSLLGPGGWEEDERRSSSRRKRSISVEDDDETSSKRSTRSRRR